MPKIEVQEVVRHVPKVEVRTVDRVVEADVLLTCGQEGRVYVRYEKKGQLQHRSLTGLHVFIFWGVTGLWQGGYLQSMMTMEFNKE